MNESPRVAAALAGGLIPAIVAFVVMLVIGTGLTPALVSAAIIFPGMTIFTWVRYDKVIRR